MTVFPCTGGFRISLKNERKFGNLATKYRAYRGAKIYIWGLIQSGCKALRMSAESTPSSGSDSPAMPLRALLYRRPSEPKTITIVFDGMMYLVRLSRHRRARRYTLRIHAATREVVLTIPPRGDLKEAKAFAERHGGWIAARLGRLPKAVPFAHGTVVPLRNMAHRIVHRRSMRGTVWRETDDRGNRLICVAGEAPYIARRISDF